jgi:hypothetical protein
MGYPNQGWFNQEGMGVVESRLTSYTLFMRKLFFGLECRSNNSLIIRKNLNLFIYGCVRKVKRVNWFYIDEL